MIYDITQELFSCQVFPGDPAPRREVLKSTERGDLYTLSALSLCAHNGTHIDAPFHFIRDGKTVDQIPLDHFTGDCFLVRHEGDVSAEDAAAILRRAIDAGASQRILIAGKATVTEDAARVFAGAGLLLLGNESQTVGPQSGPMQVHLILLGAEVILLEGIVLNDIPEGKYFLNAAPLNLGGVDGAPCRAWLMG
jgi:arylformamidase